MPDDLPAKLANAKITPNYYVTKIILGPKYFGHKKMFPKKKEKKIYPKSYGTRNVWFKRNLVQKKIAHSDTSGRCM